MKEPFVISVSGIAGSGKTTTVSALKKRLKNSVIVSFDSYSDIRLDRDINEWSADTNDENEWYVEPLVKDIEQLLNESLDYIIVDYPFGYRNLRVGQYINFAIYIDTPLDIALARRIIRDYTSREAHRNKIEVSLSVVEKELSFYLETSRPSYARMPETQIHYSDLVIDGVKSTDEIVDEIVAGLQCIE
ncbi:MAG: AAA family ATPase [Oscillospiraceae bacterium]|nr:AAA family ATPase [Oscillospiraceae bacterium]